MHVVENFFHVWIFEAITFDIRRFGHSLKYEIESRVSDHDI